MKCIDENLFFLLVILLPISHLVQDYNLHRNNKISISNLLYCLCGDGFRMWSVKPLSKFIP